ncbi:MAG TPA: histidine phosphatase family protein [Rhizomicrobium sp.]
MKRLMLLRHAKSAHDDAVADKGRPLDARGRNDAVRVGGDMHRKHYLPELVLCSPAKRTVETWQLLAPELAAPAAVQFPDRLYLASDAMIVTLVRAVDDAVSVLLVIGHNPGLERCVRTLVREPTSAMERRLATIADISFATCSLAVLDFDVEVWSHAGAAGGALVDLVRPKDLHA